MTDIAQWLVLAALALMVRDLKRYQRENEKEMSSYFKLLAKMAATLGFGRQDLEDGETENHQ